MPFLSVTWGGHNLHLSVLGGSYHSWKELGQGLWQVSVSILMLHHFLLLAVLAYLGKQQSEAERGQGPHFCSNLLIGQLLKSNKNVSSMAVQVPHGQGWASEFESLHTELVSYLHTCSSLVSSGPSSTMTDSGLHGFVHCWEPLCYTVFSMTLMLQEALLPPWSLVLVHQRCCVYISQLKDHGVFSYLKVLPWKSLPLIPCSHPLLLTTAHFRFRGQLLYLCLWPVVGEFLSAG